MQARCSASSRVHESIQFRHPARFAGQRSAQSEDMEDARSGFAVFRTSVSERVSLAACSVDRRWFWLRSIISACARLRPSRRASEIANRSHGHRCPFRQPDAVEPSFLSCLPPVSENIKQVTATLRDVGKELPDIWTGFAAFALLHRAVVRQQCPGDLSGRERPSQLLC